MLKTILTCDIESIRASREALRFGKAMIWISFEIWKQKDENTKNWFSVNYTSILKTTFYREYT